MKPDAAYRRKLARIASREDRFLIPRDCWDERDWRAQHQADAERRARRADLFASMDRPMVVAPARAVAKGFSLSDRTADRERRSRIAANKVLEKYRARPRPW